MKRTFLAAVFQLLAVAAIILSLQPCLALFIGGLYEDRRSYYEHIYWNYLVIWSWLIALAGIGGGLILFWISGAIKSKEVAAQKMTGGTRRMVKRMAAIVGLTVSAILACVFLPGLSSFFGKNVLDYHVPMDVSPRPGAGMVFMIMTNDLTTPRVEYSPPENTLQGWKTHNVSALTLPLDETN